MAKALLSISGGVVGLLVAFAQRPSFLGQSPSLAEMFQYSEFHDALLLYVGGGLGVGLLVGMLVDNFSRNNRSKGDE